MKNPTPVLLLEHDNTGRTLIIDHNAEAPTTVDAPSPRGDLALYSFEGTTVDGTPMYRRAIPAP